MKLNQWQFNVLFALAVLGAVAMLFADKIGLTVRPEVVGVFGLVMAFVLQQKDAAKKDAEKKEDATEAPSPAPVAPPVHPQSTTPPFAFTPEMLKALQELADPKAGTAPGNSPPGNMPGDNQRAADLDDGPQYGPTNPSKEN